MHPSAVLLAGLVVGTVVLAGCQSGAATSAGGGTATAAPSATITAPTTQAGPDDADADLPTPPPQPTDDPSSQQSALDVALAAVTAFARPEADAEEWWADLAPLLSTAAAQAYQGTDPAAVPASAVTGDPRLAPSASSYLATVLVPTDAGEYAVLLVREGGGAPWQVERVTLAAPAVPAGPAPTGTGPVP